MLRSSVTIYSSASIIKELVENSIDGKSTSISVETDYTTLGKIVVQDNGTGVDKRDRPILAIANTTSKIEDFQDIETVESFGFRGQALSAIADIAESGKLKMSITTRTEGEKFATQWFVNKHGKQLPPFKPVAGPVGTKIELNNVFARYPVRRKILLKEAKHTVSLIEKYLLTYSLVHDIQFDLTIRYPRKIFRRKYGGNTMIERLNKVYTVQQLKGLRNGTYKDPSGEWVWTYAIPYQESDSKKLLNLLIVNKRPMNNDNPIVKKVVEHFNNLLPSSHLWVISLTVPTRYYDINIEPSKDDVQFTDMSFLFDKFQELLTSIKIKKRVSVIDQLKDHGARQKEGNQLSCAGIGNMNSSPGVSFNASVETNQEKELNNNVDTELRVCLETELENTINMSIDTSFEHSIEHECDSTINTSYETDPGEISQRDLSRYEQLLRESAKCRPIPKRHRMNAKSIASQFISSSIMSTTGTNASIEFREDLIPDCNSNSFGKNMGVGRKQSTGSMRQYAHSTPHITDYFYKSATENSRNEKTNKDTKSDEMCQNASHIESVSERNKRNRTGEGCRSYIHNTDNGVYNGDNEKSEKKVVDNRERSAVIHDALKNKQLINERFTNTRMEQKEERTTTSRFHSLTTPSQKKRLQKRSFQIESTTSTGRSLQAMHRKERNRESRNKQIYPCQKDDEIADDVRERGCSSGWYNTSDFDNGIENRQSYEGVSKEQTSKNKTILDYFQSKNKKQQTDKNSDDRKRNCHNGKTIERNKKEVHSYFNIESQHTAEKTGIKKEEMKKVIKVWDIKIRVDLFARNSWLSDMVEEERNNIIEHVYSHVLQKVGRLQAIRTIEEGDENKWGLIEFV